MKQPKISIIISTYNRAELLRRAINSVLSQTFLDWELIIWDDGSSDRSRDVVGEFQDPRIKYFYSVNHGKSSALNQAIKIVNGLYIAILDDDDEWFPEKLKVQVDIMEECPEIDIFFTNFFNVNVGQLSKLDGFIQHASVFNRLIIKEIHPDVFLVTWGILEQLVTSNIVLPSSVIMKRSWVERNGNFREDLRNGEDLEYWFRLGAAGARFAYTNKILLYRYKQPDSLSGDNPVTYTNHIKALKYCKDTAISKNHKKLISVINRSILFSWFYLMRLCVRHRMWKEVFIVSFRTCMYLID